MPTFSVKFPGFDHVAKIQASNPEDAARKAVFSFDQIISKDHRFHGNLTVAEIDYDPASGPEYPGTYEYDLDEIIDNLMADED